MLLETKYIGYPNTAHPNYEAIDGIVEKAKFGI